MQFGHPANLPDSLAPAPRLALGYAPRHARLAWLALLALDTRLAAILRGRREPIAAQLRLAWWRERLAEAPAGWPVGEPVLEALRTWHDPAVLAELPTAWEALLADTLTIDVVGQHIDARGQAFADLARELGIADSSPAALAGRWWSAADLAANLSDPRERDLACAFGRALERVQRLDRDLRPLAVLARLGESALRRGGGPILGHRSAALLALRTGLTGW